jgi:cysteine synthase
MARMRRLGAALEIVEKRDETGGFLLTRIRRAREIACERPKTMWLNQYGNPGNPEAHYRTTGPELLRQMGGRLDVVFIPASTGGTLAGVGRYLREYSPQTLVVAVDGAGSRMFGSPVPGPRLVNGLGSARASELLERNSYDYVVRISAQAAFAYCRALADAGVLVGGSSGAAVAAAAIELRGEGLVRALCLCADHGGSYRSTIFDDGWLLANGLSLAEEELVLS